MVVVARSTLRRGKIEEEVVDLWTIGMNHVIF
jgi:hypothetical protein